MTVLGLANNLKGKYQQAAIDPIAVQAGDQVIVTGSVVTFVRNGVVVGTRQLGAVSAVSLGATVDETVNSVVFLKVTPMAGISVTLENVVPASSGETVYFNFSSGTQREFPSLEAALTAVEYLDTQSEASEDFLILQVCRKMAANGGDIQSMSGMKCSINGAATRPVSID